MDARVQGSLGAVTAGSPRGDHTGQVDLIPLGDAGGVIDLTAGTIVLPQDLLADTGATLPPSALQIVWEDGWPDLGDSRAVSDAAKRVVDVTLAAAALVVLAPLLLVVVAIIRLSSPGSAIFAQQRPGRGGEVFTCLKFRTMTPDAEERLEALLASDPALAEEFRRNGKLRRDPRVTRIGRFLRLTSLDELPQLVNVLRGDMSIVGPRPILLSQIREYGPALQKVSTIRPGLTGLWQVSGRSNLTMRERVALDLRYVNQRSLVMDLGIVARTVLVLLHPGGTGAY